MAQSANFSDPGGEPVFISVARQKTFGEVNEQGTGAAAVIILAGVSAGIGINPPKPFEMIGDRPFPVVTEDQKSKTVLFMGIIFDPASS